MWQQEFFNCRASFSPFSCFRFVKTFPYILTVLTVLQFKNRYTVYSIQFLFSKFRNSGYRIQNTVFPKHFSSSVSSVSSVDSLGCVEPATPWHSPNKLGLCAKLNRSLDSFRKQNIIRLLLLLIMAIYYYYYIIIILLYYYNII